MSFFARFTGSTSTLFAVFVMTASVCIAGHAQAKTDTSKMPWMNKALSPDQRADMVVQQMTLDEKIQMVHGTGWGVLRAGDPVPAKSNFAAGYMEGIERLGIPGIDLADSAVGARMAALSGALRDSVAFDAWRRIQHWDADSAFLYG